MNQQKIEELEAWPLSEKQKEKIYHDFQKEEILQGVNGLKSVGARKDVRISLYDAIKNGYMTKQEESQRRIEENKKFVKHRLERFEDQTIQRLKLEICRNWVLFSLSTGYTKAIECNSNLELQAMYKYLNLS